MYSTAQKNGGRAVKLLGVTEIMALTGRGQTWAYTLIRKLNAELKAQGYLTIPGKVPEKYVLERFYG